MPKWSWDYSLQFRHVDFPYHRMCFPATGLSIREYRAIVAQEHILYQIIRSPWVYYLLLAVCSENVIECKIFNIVGLTGMWES